MPGKWNLTPVVLFSAERVNCALEVSGILYNILALVISLSYENIGFCWFKKNACDMFYITLFNMNLKENSEEYTKPIS